MDFIEVSGQPGFCFVYILEVGNVRKRGRESKRGEEEGNGENTLEPMVENKSLLVEERCQEGTGT